MRYATYIIKGLPSKDNPHAAVVPPISLATTYVQKALGEEGAFVYQRGGNPTRAAVESLAAGMEGASHAFAFATGMAASSAVFELFGAQDKIVFNAAVYGGTYRYSHQLFASRGIECEMAADINELDELDGKTKAIFIETPANPTLRVTDIRKAADLAHKHNAILIVDNTFLTSYLQRPLELGADIVVYSATKFLGGHADALAGLAITNDERIASKLKLFQNTMGAPLSPFDSYSLIRGIKTLSVRMDRHLENTEKLIAFLRGRKEIKKLWYAGSHSEEEAKIQASQAKGIGSVISLELEDGLSPAAFVSNLKLFELAVSLGGVESLICHPSTMTHEAMSEDYRAWAGIPAGLLRLAIGIEDSGDLAEDIGQALLKA
ncbi:MAG: PLP-dependent aspartate aminotransferase family protein [Eubacteriaceae bacterium]|jgi:cystathionine beta-lyase|nr:PLP-dependent aspartate aminotransferase family protein [Eubacteriaceae bacterium]